MKFPVKINYNSPVILTFVIISSLILLFNKLSNGAITPLFAVSPESAFSSITSYLSLFLYIFGHESIEHLLGNMMLMLLIGPVLEEKYGSKAILLMICVTAIITGLFHILLFNTGLWGASGIVFMLIILISFTNVQKGKIPLTFILVLVVYLGKEINAATQSDNISQFAHIFGGICGAIFGFIINRDRIKSEQKTIEHAELPKQNGTL